MVRETLRLKRGVRSLAQTGHPWILADEIEPSEKPRNDGQAVAYSSEGVMLGTGFFSAHSRIAWRRFRPDLGPLDEDWIDHALQRALAKRPCRISRRLFWSESDGIPGFVVDQYGQYLVVQITTQGVESAWPEIQKSLLRLIQPKGIWVRRDAAGRKIEGLVNLTVESAGVIPEDFVRVEIGGMVVPVDLRMGQKTGTYLDQQDNYSIVAEAAKGKRVLDLYCHNGGFALRCAAAGAQMVTGVDRSETSLRIAKLASLENSLTIRWPQEDAVRFLRSNRKGEYDLVIVDPPGLAKSRDSRAASLRFMAEIHRQAIRVLVRGGTLVSFSCSHRVGVEDLRGMIQTLAVEEKRGATFLRTLSQAADHPHLSSFPESQYLTGWMVELK